MRLALVMVTGSLIAAACSGQDVLKKPVVYTVPGMDSVQVTRGIVYRTDGDVSLQMDVYRPPNLQKNERRPAVLFLHGGANISKAPAQFPAPTEWGVYQSYGRLMGASGLIGVTFNQRIGDPQDGLQKGFGDVRAAIEYVRSHAADLQVAPDRLCLAAYSAGAPLLAIGIGDPQPYIRCLVGFYAVLDIRPPISPERFAFSPIEQLKLHAEKLPPIFLARAGKDSAGLNATIDRFVAEAASRDVAIEFHNIRGVPHAFDIQTPSPEVRNVIARVIAFMKASLEQ
jgi:acetyl esterase/lipase